MHNLSEIMNLEMSNIEFQFLLFFSKSNGPKFIEMINNLSNVHSFTLYVTLRVGGSRAARFLSL